MSREIFLIWFDLEFKIDPFYACHLIFLEWFEKIFGEQNVSVD